MAGLIWRPLRRTDLATLARIAADRFPDHPEDGIHWERLRLSPAWCFGLADEQEVLNGYLLSYPWARGAVPPLNAPLGRLPARTASLFLHDLAVSRAAGGRGLARIVPERLFRAAGDAGFGDVALVTVNDTDSSGGGWASGAFWPLTSQPSCRATARAPGT